MEKNAARGGEGACLAGQGCCILNFSGELWKLLCFLFFNAMAHPIRYRDLGVRVTLKDLQRAYVRDMKLLKLRLMEAENGTEEAYKHITLRLQSQVDLDEYNPRDFAVHICDLSFPGASIDNLVDMMREGGYNVRKTDNVVQRRRECTKLNKMCGCCFAFQPSEWIIIKNEWSDAGDDVAAVEETAVSTAAVSGAVSE